MKRIAIMLVAGLFLVLGVSAAPASAAPYCGITWGSSPKTAGGYSAGALTNVRTGRHDCYDRMVFDLQGATTGYRVEYVNAVYADGSGQYIPLNGGAKLQIVALAPSYNINTGQTVYPGVVGQHLPGVNLAGYQTFKDAKFAGSFEGQTTVGLGVRARLPFRVLTLDHKVVVDVAHYW